VQYSSLSSRRNAGRDNGCFEFYYPTARVVYCSLLSRGLIALHGDQKPAHYCSMNPRLLSCDTHGLCLAFASTKLYLTPQQTRRICNPLPAGFAEINPRIVSRQTVTFVTAKIATLLRETLRKGANSTWREALLFLAACLTLSATNPPVYPHRTSGYLRRILPGMPREYPTVSSAFT